MEDCPANTHKCIPLNFPRFWPKFRENEIFSNILAKLAKNFLKISKNWENDAYNLYFLKWFLWNYLKPSPASRTPYVATLSYQPAPGGYWFPPKNSSGMAALLAPQLPIFLINQRFLPLSIPSHALCVKKWKMTSSAMRAGK